jgi:hypothetical protein
MITDTYVSADFKDSEYTCPCGCGTKHVEIEHIIKMQLLREYVGLPIKHTPRGGGTRCKRYNKEVGGSDESSHLWGWASDICCEDMFRLVQGAMIIYNRVGIAKTFIHVDTDPNKPQSVYWVYK